VFSLSTVGTMITLVYLGVKAVHFLPVKRMARFTTVLTGVSMLACGVAVQFFGL